jgi:hypothetical protein
MLRHGEHSKALAEEAVEGSRRHHLYKARRFGPFDSCIVIKRERVRAYERVSMRGKKNTKGHFYLILTRKQASRQTGWAKQRKFFNALC